MFWKKSKDDKKLKLDDITNYVFPEFKEGNYYNVDALQQIFYIPGKDAEKIQKMVAESFCEQLEGASAKAWMQLDEKCRGRSIYSYYDSF